jgi:hypothetical protein
MQIPAFFKFRLEITKKSYAAIGPWFYGKTKNTSSITVILVLGDEVPPLL